MAKYVFLNIPAHGPVNPTLAVAQELVHRGEEVIYYLTEGFRSTIESTGATLRPYESLLTNLQAPGMQLGDPRTKVGTLPLLLTEESRYVLPGVLEQIRADRPDYILYVPMSMWSRIAVQVLGIPAILLHPSYVTNDHFNPILTQNAAPVHMMQEMMQSMQRDVARLFAEYNLPPLDMRTFFTHAEALNIVFLPRAFQPEGQTFDERFVFVGPSIFCRQDADPFPFDQLANQPVLYISLGTIFNKHPDFFRLCFQAFGDQPCTVVVAHGTSIDKAALGPVPQNFLLASHVRQLELLAHTSVFVTHGGMNSVMESLYHGVPMVVIPPMMEQAMTAQQVQELGLGVALRPDSLTVETLREAVTRVSTDPAIHTHTRSMQQTVRAAGGHQRATDAIMEFVRVQDATCDVRRKRAIWQSTSF
jgi:MGT family glycosyltransferase